MSIKFQTRHIFIDTSIFISKNFQIDSKLFQKLITQIKEGKLFYYTNDIIVEEIKSNIQESLKKAQTVLKPFKRDAKILYNIDKLKSIFNKFELDVLEKELFKKFDKFLEETSAIFIPLSDKISIEPIFKKYFTKKAPFGAAKKKSEFPDAFLIEILDIWFTEKKEKVYVISQDKGMIESCKSSKNLIPINKLEELLQLLAIHEEKLPKELLSLFKNNIDLVKSEIKNNFSSLGFWLSNQDGDVEDVKVTSVNIDDYYVFDVQGDYAEVELSATVTFECDVSYYDLDTASWDSEDKVLIPSFKIEKTIERIIEIQVDIGISYDEYDTTEFGIMTIVLNHNNDIAIDTDEDDLYYK